MYAHLVAGVPDPLGVAQPGLSLQDHVENHVDIYQDVHIEYFFISSSSRIRSHSSSVGAGWSDFNNRITWSAEKYLASGKAAAHLRGC